jgi:hypothetical protein
MSSSRVTVLATGRSPPHSWVGACRRRPGNQPRGPEPRQFLTMRPGQGVGRLRSPGLGGWCRASRAASRLFVVENALPCHEHQMRRARGTFGPKATAGPPGLPEFISRGQLRRKPIFPVGKKVQPGHSRPGWTATGCMVLFRDSTVSMASASPGATGTWPCRPRTSAPFHPGQRTSARRPWRRERLGNSENAANVRQPFCQTHCQTCLADTASPISSTTCPVRETTGPQIRFHGPQVMLEFADGKEKIQGSRA